MSDENTISTVVSEKEFNPRGDAYLLVLAAFALVGLTVAARYNYLLFHTLAEGFSIIVACSVFMLAWNLRRLLDNDYLPFVGIAYLFVAMLDFVHTISYSGIAIIATDMPDIATRFWIAARYMESIALLISPVFLRYRMRTTLVFSIFLAITTVLTYLIFAGLFPVCFIPGIGLTTFKVASEYLISLILTGALVALYLHGKYLNPLTMRLIAASIVATIMSEMAFTLYLDPDGFFNMLGHFLKIISFYLIYRAIVVDGLRHPLEVFYRRLKEKREALEKSEERSRGTLDNMMEGCQLIGFDWRYLYVNEVAAEHGRMPKDKLVGHTMMEKHPGIENSGIFPVMKSCMINRTTHRIENLFHYPDGSSRWFDLFIQPVPEGIFILSIDITDRKHMEEEIARKANALAVANKELESFSYFVSHDLRNHLNNISIMTSVIRDFYIEKLDDEGKACILGISDGITIMSNTIKALLRLAKTSYKELEIVRTDLSAMARSIIEQLQKTDECRMVDVRIQPGLFINADKYLFYHAMENLLENAWKYTSLKTEPLIEFGCNAAGNTRIFYVRDNGSGFDMENAERLFKPFKRLHRKEDFSGTGIGLSVVYKIITRHGGKIWAESKEGKGAVFFFTIPG